MQAFIDRFFRQITVEKCEEVTDTHGRVKYFWKRKLRDNHLGDCEWMIHTGAMITKTLQMCHQGGETCPL